MKKLMIAAAIVCAAITSQASSVNWSSTSVPYFFDTSALAGNKDYTAGGLTMQNSGYTFSYVLAVTLAVSDVAATDSATVKYNIITGKFNNNGITIDGSIAAGTTYNYLITITTDLSGMGKVGEWDYSAATATTSISGVFDGSSGASNIQSGIPAIWTVSGAQAVPEPTSGLLLLLGVAGLALRRKQK